MYITKVHRSHPSRAMGKVRRECSTDILESTSSNKGCDAVLSVMVHIYTVNMHDLKIFLLAQLE